MMLIWTRGGGFTTRGGWAHAPPIFIRDLTRISLPCILETTSRIFFRNSNVRTRISICTFLLTKKTTKRPTMKSKRT